MNFLNLKKLSLLIALGLLSLPAHAGWLDLNMPKGVTDISNEVYGLHMLILYICIVIGVLVFGAMFWSILKHRNQEA